MSWMTFDIKHREDHCFGVMRNHLATDCEKWIDGYNHKNPIVKIKGVSIQKADRFDKDTWFDRWPCYITQLYRSARTDFNARMIYKCESWFQDNYGFFRDMFLHFSGYKTLEFAIKSTETFMDLWGQMEEWMMNRWRIWMKKMEVEIQKKTGVAVPRVPSSHGGVANLLKILTRTMEKQGADIRSIAKVQYAVCVQAGVMIPDVFLTDVASALDYKEAMENIDG